MKKLEKISIKTAHPQYFKICGIVKFAAVPKLVVFLNSATLTFCAKIVAN